MADAILKTCSCCGFDKPQTDFYKHGGGKLRSDCKPCTNRRQGAYTAKNGDRIAAYKKKWHEQNASKYKEAKRAKYLEQPEQTKRRAAEFQKANPERVRGYKKKWKRENPEAMREYSFLRSKTRKLATPKWANREAMVALYRKARMLTKSTGVEYHVDHIVPLLGATVCGLHCEQNMQVLDAFANQSKLNRWWPDMPCGE